MKWTKEMIEERAKGITPEQFEILLGSLDMLKDDYFRNLDYSENLSTPFERTQAKERAKNTEIMYRGALGLAYQICSPQQWDELIEKTTWI